MGDENGIGAVEARLRRDLDKMLREKEALLEDIKVSAGSFRLGFFQSFQRYVEHNLSDKSQILLVTACSRKVICIKQHCST